MTPEDVDRILMDVNTTWEEMQALHETIISTSWKYEPYDPNKFKALVLMNVNVGPSYWVSMMTGVSGHGRSLRPYACSNPMYVLAQMVPESVIVRNKPLTAKILETINLKLCQSLVDPLFIPGVRVDPGISSYALTAWTEADDSNESFLVETLTIAFDHERRGRRDREEEGPGPLEQQIVRWLGTILSEHYEDEILFSFPKGDDAQMFLRLLVEDANILRQDQHVARFWGGHQYRYRVSTRDSSFRIRLLEDLLRGYEPKDAIDRLVSSFGGKAHLMYDGDQTRTVTDSIRRFFPEPPNLYAFGETA